MKNMFREFPTRMVYLYYISSLGYTILIGNPRYMAIHCVKARDYLFWVLVGTQKTPHSSELTELIKSHINVHTDLQHDIQRADVSTHNISQCLTGRGPLIITASYGSVIVNSSDFPQHDPYLFDGSVCHVLLKSPPASIALIHTVKFQGMCNTHWRTDPPSWMEFSLECYSYESDTSWQRLMSCTVRNEDASRAGQERVYSSSFCDLVFVFKVKNTFRKYLPVTPFLIHVNFSSIPDTTPLLNVSYTDTNNGIP